MNKFAEQITSEIISNKKVGAYHHMVFSVGDIAKHAKPGNFVAISIGGATSSMVLRRAFAIYRASDRGVSGGFVELVIAPHGPGSIWLTSLAPGATVNLVGPLGTAFGIPTEPVKRDRHYESCRNIP